MINNNNKNNYSPNTITTMGNIFQTVMNRFTSTQKQSRIILIGLDGAGKTTLLFNMKLGEVVNTVPTIGFNMEAVQYKNIEFNMWDVGGQDRLRALWHHYYEGADAIIYVVDSSDRDRIDEAAETLASVLSDETLKGADLLVYANKQDMQGCIGISELANKL